MLLRALSLPRALPPPRPLSAGGRRARTRRFHCLTRRHGHARCQCCSRAGESVLLSRRLRSACSCFGSMPAHCSFSSSLPFTRLGSASASASEPDTLTAVVAQLSAFFAQRQRSSSASAASVSSSPSFSSSSAAPCPSPASVLVGLFAHPVSGAVHVLLTLRSSGLSSHQGEVSLPGGKREAQDADDAATACREAEEEVGLSPAQARVVGLMDRVRSKAGMMVRPVVAVIPAPQLSRSGGLSSSPASFSPSLNAAEVSAVFSLPLSCFLSSAGHRSEDVPLTSGGLYRMHFITRSTADWLPAADAAPAVTAGRTVSAGVASGASELQRPQREFVVWGFTAHVLIVAARVAFARAPDFVFLPPPVDSSGKGGRAADTAAAQQELSKL